jgi:murein DD-endopeptidase MepM/ murein hydrolase activator NlpD
MSRLENERHSPIILLLGLGLIKGQMKNDLSRRDFIKTSSIVLAASFLNACNLNIPTGNPATAAAAATKERLPRALNPAPTRQAGPTFTPTGEAAPTTAPTAANDPNNSSPPPAINAPLNDAPEVFLNTYYGAIGASPPTPQNPGGIHMGMDFVAPTGTPIKAAAPGKITRITTQTKTEPDGTVNTYGGILQDIGGANTLGYGFEPLQNLIVTDGQEVKTGDILGTLADNRGQNMRGTKGTGTLDFMLLSLVDGSFKSVCFVPYASPAFKTLMETWFSRVYTPTAEHPGPCTCHYYYP